MMNIQQLEDQRPSYAKLGSVEMSETVSSTALVPLPANQAPSFIEYPARGCILHSDAEHQVNPISNHTSDKKTNTF
jgi:hypothetical protein